MHVRKDYAAKKAVSDRNTSHEKENTKSTAPNPELDRKNSTEKKFFKSEKRKKSIFFDKEI